MNQTDILKEFQTYIRTLSKSRAIQIRTEKKLLSLINNSRQSGITSAAETGMERSEMKASP